MNLYKIKDWDRLYENNRTREMKRLGWVPVPNKQDGDGFRAVIHHEDGLKIFGAWVLMLQIASKCNPRGTLVRDNGMPHTERTIARMTGAQEGDIYIAIQHLASREVDWICYDHVTIPQEGAVASHPAAEIAPEWKGTEQKGKEEETPAAGDILSLSLLGPPPVKQKGRAELFSPGFVVFWDTWPSHFRKKDRIKCWKLWEARGLESRWEEIEEKVRAWAASDQWTKNDGNFMPGPLPWLNQESYDAPPPPPSGGSAAPDDRDGLGPYNPPASALEAAFALDQEGGEDE
jgi:hypothetical protein